MTIRVLDAITLADDPAVRWVLFDIETGLYQSIDPAGRLYDCACEWEHGVPTSVVRNAFVIGMVPGLVPVAIILSDAGPDGD